MSELPKSIERLDKLFLTFVSVSFAVPAIAGAYGLDVRLVWGSVIFYAVWIIIKAFIPTIKLSYTQRAIIEKIRGLSYVFSLGFTFLSNFVMLAILPRTFDMFIIGIVVVAFILRLIVTFVPRTFFRKEIIYMTKKQEREIYEILKNIGSASIFFSISVLTLNIEFVGLKEFSVTNVALILVPAFALFILGIYNERKSSNLAHELAISLINSGWYKKYSAKS